MATPSAIAVRMRVLIGISGVRCVGVPVHHMPNRRSGTDRVNGANEYKAGQVHIIREM
jgi:hypothetical protein